MNRKYLVLTLLPIIGLFLFPPYEYYGHDFIGKHIGNHSEIDWSALTLEFLLVLSCVLVARTFGLFEKMPILRFRYTGAAREYSKKFLKILFAVGGLILILALIKAPFVVPKLTKAFRTDASSYSESAAPAPAEMQAPPATAPNKLLDQQMLNQELAEKIKKARGIFALSDLELGRNDIDCFNRTALIAESIQALGNHVEASSIIDRTIDSCTPKGIYIVNRSTSDFLILNLFEIKDGYLLALGENTLRRNDTTNFRVPPGDYKLVISGGSIGNNEQLITVKNGEIYQLSLVEGKSQ